jgi:hypothetical protein
MKANIVNTTGMQRSTSHGLGSVLYLHIVLPDEAHYIKEHSHDECKVSTFHREYDNTDDKTQV